MLPQNFQIIAWLFWYILIAILCFKMQNNCRKKICKNCFIKQYRYVLAIGIKKRKIGNDTPINKASLTFLERRKKNPLKKLKKTPENSMTTKHLCKQNEPVMIAIDKKQKIEKIHKEWGQSNRQLSSTTVTDTEEPDQSNLQLSSTTVADTTIEESKNKIYVAFKNIFSDIKTEQIHNYYFCQQWN